MKRNCDNCNKEYTPDQRNLKRGWGLTCSKSCAAQKRERSKYKIKPKRYTSEGYEIINDIAYDGDEPMYKASKFEDSIGEGIWS